MTTHYEALWRVDVTYLFSDKGKRLGQLNTSSLIASKGGKK